MISVEKPGSPSEILEHHGTKGMKWGIQKRVTGSGAFKSFSKAANKNVANYNARQSAKRARPPTKGIALGRSSREFRAQHPTAKLQAHAIKNARRDQNERLKTIRKTKDTVEKARLIKEHRNNPGTAVALRTTRGEKTVGILLAQIPGANLPITAYGAATVGTRRFVERKQRRGGFQ